MASVFEQADGRWGPILEALGVPKQYLSPRQGPCPKCGGKDRFRWDNADGKGSYICNNCGAGYGGHLLRLVHGWTWEEVLKQVQDVLGVVGDRKDRVERKMSEGERRLALRHVWTATRKCERDDPVDLYLRARGLRARPAPLRTACALPYAGPGSPEMPCMVALLTDISGNPATLHRTFLTEDGAKADVTPTRKLMPGGMGTASAVRLAEPAAGMLGVAEGIETAMAATQLFGTPCWSVISAGGMEKWMPPTDTKITQVTIFGDNDESFTGQKAAYTLAFKLRQQGLDIEVKIPDAPGDWNDVLQEGRSNDG